jgi:hypothetical protein
VLAVLGLISAVVLASPVDAHHKPGHAGGPPASSQSKHTDKNKSNDNTSANLMLSDGPPAGPGNSGVAHWCTLYWNDPGIEDEVGRTFNNHGDCVSSFARQRNEEAHIDIVESAFGNGNGNGNGSSDLGRNGDLQILTARLGLDGTFRLRGTGAEDNVKLTELRGNGVSIDVKDSQVNNDGDWVVSGTWDCSDHDGLREGRFEASDNDETDRLSVSFPCGSL